MADTDETTPAKGAESTATTEETITVPEGAKDPDAVRNAIRAEREAAKAARAEADKFKAEAETLRTKLENVPGLSKDEVETLQTDLASTREELGKVKPLVDRYEVAAAKGLDLRLASRLQGDTREAMEADADSLAEMFSGSGAPDFDAGARGTAAAPKPTPEQAHQGLIAQILGGGVSTGSDDQ